LIQKGIIRFISKLRQLGFSRNSTEPTGRREKVVSDAFFKIGEEFVLRLEGTDALGIPGSRRWQFESHLKRSRQK
jgi:hypothetical protein